MNLPAAGTDFALQGAEHDLSDSPRVNILMVDDRPENLLALQAILEDLGQNLVRATSGMEALRRLLEDDFAVILLDVQMPEMDGFETAALIRSRDRSRRTPIVFVTAFEKSEFHVNRGYSLGAVDYLFKPIVPEVLKAKVTAFVDLALKARALELEVQRRARAEEEIRRLNESLERIVAERTAELSATNRELRREITERQKAEEERTRLLEREQAARAEAEAANAAKDDFLAMVSHELRTPLTSILGWVRMLRSGTLDPARSEKGLEVIERNARLQAQLIEDLLDVSRIIAGKLRVERKPVDLRAVIRSAVDALHPVAESRGVNIRTEIGEDLVAIGDAARLEQVVWNLVSNAVKFTPAEGTVTITLNRDGDHAVLAVADTGEGIEAEMLPHVFERFWQRDSGLTRSHGGLGLGLAIVRYLVEAHDGAVCAESGGAGQGSTFTLRLPLLAAGQEPGEE